jgi:hypothetical protein
MASAINAKIGRLISQIEDWKETDELLKMKMIVSDNSLLGYDKEILEALKAARHGNHKKLILSGGLDKNVLLKSQDILGLKPNEYDFKLGSNFIVASSDGGQTSARYWKKKDNTVIKLEDHTDELIIQLAAPEILDEVLWPLFTEMKNNILDKLNSMCPFVQEIPNSFPWGTTNKFAVSMQDCCSSWILEHFGDIGLNYKAVPSEEEIDGVPKNWTITQFTDVYTTLSRDRFVDYFEDKFPFLCGHYSKKLNEHPLPYSNNKDDYSFAKLNLDSITMDGECPTWDKALVERFENDEEGDVFKAAVWQVYNASNRSRQLIYMYDPHGRSGKSAMMRAAFYYLRGCMQSLQKDSLKGNFAAAKIWNKQLVTIGDTKDPQLLRSQIVHTMTGGDFMDVEYKGKNSFSAPFRGHIWANGNIKLCIDTDAEHEVSRLVLFDVKKPKSAKLYQYDKDGNVLTTEDGTPLLGAGDPSWEQKLIDELPYFLKKCRAAYSIYCPTNSDIVLPAFMQERIRNECADTAKIVFDDFLGNNVIMGTGEITDTDFRNKWKEWKDNNMDRYEKVYTYEDLCNHLSKLKYKCSNKRLPSGKRQRVWPNISLNAFKPLKDMNEGKDMNNFD